MKVKVSFDGTTVVVPCGTGDEEVHTLFDKAAMRFKKATGKGDGVVVEVSALKIAAGDALLYADDTINDVLDDKELLNAVYTISGETSSAVSNMSAIVSSSGTSNVPSSAAGTPSPFPASLTPSPVGDLRQNLPDDQKPLQKLSDEDSAHERFTEWPASPRRPLLGPHVPRPEPPATHAPTSLPEDPEQSIISMAVPHCAVTASPVVSRSGVDLSRTGKPSPRVSPTPSPSASRASLTASPPRRQPRVEKSPMSVRARREAKPSLSNSELDTDKEDEKADQVKMPAGMFHGNSVPLLPSEMSGTWKRPGVGGLQRGMVTQSSTMVPSRYLMKKWQKQEVEQQQQQHQQQGQLQQIQEGEPAEPSQSQLQHHHQQQQHHHHHHHQQQQQQHPQLQPSQDLSYDQPDSPNTRRRRLVSAGQILADIELSCRGDGDQVGVYVRGYRTSDDRDIGVFVREIRPGTVAAENGLIHVGDRLVCVNGRDLTTLSNNQAVALFQEAVRTGSVKMQVSRATGSVDDPPNSPSPSPPPPASSGDDYSRHSYLPPYPAGGTSSVGETTSGNAVSSAAQQPSTMIASGTASKLATQTSTAEIQATESAAAVEQVQQRGVLPATNTLPSSAGRRVGRQIRITLDKCGAASLGFSVTSRDVAVGDDRDRPVYIKAVTKGGVAFRDNRLRANDRLLEVDGTSLTGMSQQEAVRVLKATSGQVSLLLWREEAVAEGDSAIGGPRRPGSATSPPATEQKAIEAPAPAPAPTQSPPPSPSKVAAVTVSPPAIHQAAPVASSPATDVKTPSISSAGAVSESMSPPLTARTASMPPNSGPVHKPNPTPPPAVAVPAPAPVRPVLTPRLVIKQMLFTIPLTSSGSAGLGISVKGKTAVKGDQQGPSDLGDVGHGIYIKSVLPGGAAAKDGRLQPSDRLVSINGENLSSLSDYEAFDSLRRCMSEASKRPSIDLMIERQVNASSPAVMARSHPPEQKRSTGSIASVGSTSQERPAAPPSAASAAASGSRERSIEGEFLSRPKDPPSAMAKQQAMAIGSQLLQLQQQTGPTGQQQLNVASKKHSSSEVSTDSGVGPDTAHIEETGPIPNHPPPTLPTTRGNSKPDPYGGRGYTGNVSLLKKLRESNAATTAPAATTADTSSLTTTAATSSATSQQPYAPGVKPGGKSPLPAAAAETGAWRSGGSGSSGALLSSAVPSDTSAAGRGADSGNQRPGPRTLVEVVSEGTLTGRGTRFVPTSPESDRGVSPGLGEPTKVSVRASVIDPPSTVIIRQVEVPVFTKSPVEERARPIDARPDSAPPPISRHTVFVSGMGGRYRPGEPADEAYLYMEGGEASDTSPHHGTDGSPLVLRNTLDGGGKNSSPSVRRKEMAMSVVHPQRHNNVSSDEEMDEYLIHRKLANSELPEHVDDWSRMDCRYPAFSTLPRKWGRKKQRGEIPSQMRGNDADDNQDYSDGRTLRTDDDSLSELGTQTGSSARTRNPVYFPVDGDAMDSDEEDVMPLLSRTGLGRRSISERHKASLNAKQSMTFQRIERGRLGKGRSSVDGEAEAAKAIRRLSGSNVSGHRRAASFESLPQALSQDTISSNLSNSPKARRLLGIQTGESNQANGAPRQPFQRKQSFEKGATSPDGEGLGGELIGRPGSSNTIQFGTKSSSVNSQKKKGKLFKFFKLGGKGQRRPRGMPAPLPPLHGQPGSFIVRDESFSSITSPESVDDESVSSQPIAPGEDVDPSSVFHANGPTSGVGDGDDGEPESEEREDGEVWNTAFNGRDDPADDQCLHGGFQSEIQLREGVSLEQLREQSVRSGSTGDVRRTSSHGNISPMSPLLVSPPVLVIKDTI